MIKLSCIKTNGDSVYMTGNSLSIVWMSLGEYGRSLSNQFVVLDGENVGAVMDFHSIHVENIQGRPAYIEAPDGYIGSGRGSKDDQDN